MTAAWFGWPVRTFECAVPREKLGIALGQLRDEGLAASVHSGQSFGAGRAEAAVLQRRDHRAQAAVSAGYVLLDLDGTLSDSAPGILASLRHAFADVGVAPLDERTERSLLGPPFYESLVPLVGADLVPAVIDAYRRYYDTAMFDTTVYDGILDVLADLRERGLTLAVATSKPEYYAIPIVEHLGIDAFFATVGGDALDGSRDTKAKVIAEVLRRLGHPRPDHVLMLGDRSHDVDGARSHSIDCLGAGWGYASPGELTGAIEVFATPHDLRGAHDRLFGVQGAASA